MAGKYEMSFPQYVDRPRLILMYEMDEVVYTLLISFSLSTALLFATGIKVLAVLLFCILIPLSHAVVVEAKKTTGLPGGLFYIRYAAGFVDRHQGKSKKELFAQWPELKRIGHLDFCPNGFEDEFYS